MCGDTVRMRFDQCGMGTSPLLIYEVYIVCSQPLIPDPSQRWCLPSEQWAPHSWEMKFTSVQPAPSKDQVYPVYNEPPPPPPER